MAILGSATTRYDERRNERVTARHGDRVALVHTHWFRLTFGVSWLSGLVGLGLLYHGWRDDFWFTSGVACLVFALALFRWSREWLVDRIARGYLALGDPPEMSLQNAEQLVAHLEARWGAPRSQRTALPPPIEFD